MHHIFVNEKNVDLNNNLITVSADEDIENYNHLVSALRIKLKEEVLCSVIPFNHSFDYKTKVVLIDKNQIQLLIDEKTEGRELPVDISLKQSIIKNDKFELVIEKAVELGVNSIVPVKSDYSIVKYDENDNKYKAKIERFNKIAKSAAEQSKRNIVPRVLEPISFEKACSDCKGEYNLLFYENANDIIYTKKVINDIKNEIKGGLGERKTINIFIGPEGGYSDKEIKIAKDNNFEILSLGARILRTETAAIVAASIVMYEFENGD